MEEPDPAISPAVHRDLQTDLKVSPAACSGHSLQLSLGTSSASSNTNSGCKIHRSCSTIACNNIRGNISNGNSSKCNNSSCNSNKICSPTTCNTSCCNGSLNGDTGKNCNASGHGNSSNNCNTSGHGNSSACKASCNSESGDEKKVCELSRQPDASNPEKEVLVSAVSRQSNELRLNRRRTKSLPCLHDPSDFFSEFNGGLRKKVKFADSLGLSLASVKHFRASDEPYIPSKVFLRLQSFPAIVDDLNEKFKALGIHCLRPAFSMPCEASDFMQRAERNRVCLENVTVSHFDVHGLIRVLNVSYVKEVTVRYTFNNWLSCMDTAAKYVEGSSHSGTDQFSFDLSIPPFLDQGSFVHFAICYRADNEEYWDNNFDKNYSLQCESTSDEHANS
ncbi:protein phosphatase 1 regulatory subunit 3G [Stegostoma tigrinum]|uniref:protein phosphatase 1 regulatory subunit 3G n=1 Tax=Stegostoma tigrinum TaxID=3053191 RepID=UPI00202AEFE8|nr:protein phosphatase 1 regulatory subunit 3G [Stegostoma tigrinum]XP_048376189.1 protein phosphatase 1 regulatory subunit 3G [Stegostoma tigrinum]